MTLDEAREHIGANVVYRPDGRPAPETGVITSVGELLVFVRYVGDRHSKGTYAGDLDLLRCELCQEPVRPGDETQPLNGGLFMAHRECLLRNVMGGIGHLEDHLRWCVQAHDPDGGRTYRQSALEVDAWIRRWGIEAASETR